MLHTLRTNFLQPQRDFLVERRRHLYIETAPDKSQTQRLRRQLRKLDANPTKNAFARLEDDAARLELLLECALLTAKAVRICDGGHRVLLASV